MHDWALNFAKALCDLRTSINLIPLAIYQQLGLRAPKPTSIQQLMADCLVKRLVGIPYDVLVKVLDFIFPADFIIIDCELNFKVLITFGRTFLATGKELVDMEKSDLNFRLSDEELKFDVYQLMKKPRDMSVVFIIDMVEESEKVVPIKERFAIET